MQGGFRCLGEQYESGLEAEVREGIGRMNKR